LKVESQAKGQLSANTVPNLSTFNLQLSTPSLMSHPRSSRHSLNRRHFLASLAAAGTASAMFATRLRAEAAPISKIPDDLLFTSAKKLAAMIKSKKVSSTEVVTAYIKRIEAVNPKLNAVVFPTFERALTTRPPPPVDHSARCTVCHAR
jgi:hypothetical protein